MENRKTDTQKIQQSGNSSPTLEATPTDPVVDQSTPVNEVTPSKRDVTPVTPQIMNGTETKQNRIKKQPKPPITISSQFVNMEIEDLKYSDIPQLLEEYKKLAQCIGCK